MKTFSQTLIATFAKNGICHIILDEKNKELSTAYPEKAQRFSQIPLSTLRNLSVLCVKKILM